MGLGLGLGLVLGVGVGVGLGLGLGSGLGVELARGQVDAQCPTVISPVCLAISPVYLPPVVRSMPSARSARRSSLARLRARVREMARKKG